LQKFSTRFEDRISLREKVVISVGVIGTGNIGQNHIRRIAQTLSGASVVAVTDSDSARAQKTVKDLGGGAKTTGQNLIAAEDTDAAIEPPERIEKELLGK
jgi:predicted homoserine dehydrogenase-like protein